MKILRSCLVPAAMLVAQVTVWPGLALWRGDPVDRVEMAAGLAASVLAAIALSWRRSAPVTALAGVSAALTVGQLATPREALMVMLVADVVALFTVAARRPARIGVGAAVALSVWQSILGLAVYGPGREYVAGLLLSLAVYFLTLGLGHSRGRWRAARQAAADRLARAEASRKQASAAERQRLARELHDVSAHHLTSIVVTVTAAQRLADRRPELAAEALEFAARTGRETLSALHRLVAVMQGVEHSVGPSLSDSVDELANGFVALGQPVSVTVTLGCVDATVAHAAYGIVREALTNALRHAPGGPVRVRIGQDDDALEVVVENEAGKEPAAAATLGSGRGLAGMRQRAETLGGTLNAGPAPDGGWRVRALLPPATPSTEDNPHRTVRSLGLPGAATAFALPPAFALFPDPELPRLTGTGFALLVLLSALHALPLIWRRQAPWPVLCAVLATTALWPLAVGLAQLPSEALAFLSFGIGAEVVAVYAVAVSARSHAEAWLCALLVAAVLSGVVVAGAAIDGTLAAETLPNGTTSPAVVAASWWWCLWPMLAIPFGAVYCLGYAVQRRKRRVLARERLAVAASTADAFHIAYTERVRVAAGLRAKVLRDTEAVVSAAEQAKLGDVLESARTALTAMRELLSDMQGEAARAPQPTAAAIDGLCQAQRAAGRDVEFQVLAFPRPLPPAVDVSAYRVVQTALSAGDTEPARVTVGYGHRDLTITVSGVPTATTGPVAAGLRARITALGGRMIVERIGTMNVWLPDHP